MPLSIFFKNVKNMWVGTPDVYLSTMIPTANGTSFNLENADTISTVYTCIKTLADTLSRLPLNVYIENDMGRVVDKEDYRYPLVHFNPNNYTSSQTFFAALEYYRNLKGNSFARIYRSKNGKILSLEIIPPSSIVAYQVENNELYYKYKDENDKEIVINASEMLHFRSLTKDGIWGINPIEALRLNISTTFQGMNTIDNFYKNNISSPKFIKSIVNSATNTKAMAEAVTDLKSKFAGSYNAGQLITLPPNTEISELSLNMADAMFIDTIKFNTTQIAALYGVPPHMVGILEATKFNNVEMMMLDFKATTLTAIARMYRQELEFKLLTTEERLNGKSIEWNLMALVEADSTTRIENIRKLANLGAISPNDVAKLEGYPTYKGGDYHYIPGNYLPAENIAVAPTQQPKQN
jgi:HK97 family phage portal protein